MSKNEAGPSMSRSGICAPNRVCSCNSDRAVTHLAEVHFNHEAVNPLAVLHKMGCTKLSTGSYIEAQLCQEDPSTSRKAEREPGEKWEKLAGKKFR